MPSFSVVAYRHDDPTVVVDPQKPETWPQRHAFTRVGARRDVIVEDLLSEGYETIVSVRQIERLPSWKPRYREQKAVLYRHIARALRRRVSRVQYATVLGEIFDETDKFAKPAHNFLVACADKDFYRAMEAQPDVFEEYEVNLLQIGAGGNEAEMFDILADSLSVEERMAKRIAGVLAWPGIILVAVVVMLWVFMYKLLPNLILSMQAASPESTPDQIADKLVFPLGSLYHLSIFLKSPLNDVVAVFTLASTIAFFYLLFRYIRPLRLVLDSVLMFHTRSFGRIIRMSRENKLLHILRLLLKGQQQLDAYSIAISSAVGEIAVSGMKAAAESFRNGGFWSEHLRHCGVISRAHVGRLIAAEQAMGVPGIIEEMDAIIPENDEDIEREISKFEKQLLAGSSVGLFLLVYGLFSAMIFPLQGQITKLH